MSIKQRIAQKTLKEALTQQGHETKPYDTQATVTRIQNDTAWVHIPGGIKETPAALYIDAKVGDTVNVRVSGGSAWLTGNRSAPPTDDTAANDAKKNAKDAKVTAVQAQGTADGAKSLADKAGSVAENAADAAGTAGAAAKQAAAQADQAKTNAANAKDAAAKVNVKFSSLIRKTDDGIECGMLPDASTLLSGYSVTVPVALVNTDGSFDVNLVTYTNSDGTVSRTKSVRFASFGTEAIIGELGNTHARIDTDSFDIIDAEGSIRASLGGTTPLLQIGAFTWINRENGNLTLRLN
jgi:hypothetical protein